MQVTVNVPLPGSLFVIIRDWSATNHTPITVCESEAEAIERISVHNTVMFGSDESFAVTRFSMDTLVECKSGTFTITEIHTGVF